MNDILLAILDFASPSAACALSKVCRSTHEACKSHGANFLEAVYAGEEHLEHRTENLATRERRVVLRLECDHLARYLPPPSGLQLWSVVLSFEPHQASIVWAALGSYDFPHLVHLELVSLHESDIEFEGIGHPHTPMLHFRDLHALAGYRKLKCLSLRGIGCIAESGPSPPRKSSLTKFSFSARDIELDPHVVVACLPAAFPSLSTLFIRARWSTLIECSSPPSCPPYSDVDVAYTKGRTLGALRAMGHREIRRIVLTLPEPVEEDSLGDIVLFLGNRQFTKLSHLDDIELTSADGFQRVIRVEGDGASLEDVLTVAPHLNLAINSLTVSESLLARFYTVNHDAFKRVSHLCVYMEPTTQSPLRRPSPGWFNFPPLLHLEVIGDDRGYELEASVLRAKVAAISDGRALETLILRHIGVVGDRSVLAPLAKVVEIRVTA